MSQITDDDSITTGNRAVFEDYMNATYMGNALKNMLPLAPESFSENINTKDITIPAIKLTIQDTKESFVFQEQNIITIGRMDEVNNITPSLDFKLYGGATLGVSRRHAKISYQQGKFYLMDLGSSNGTWINEQKLAPRQMTPIYSGDVLSFGQLKLIVS